MSLWNGFSLAMWRGRRRVALISLLSMSAFLLAACPSPDPGDEEAVMATAFADYDPVTANATATASAVQRISGTATALAFDLPVVSGSELQGFVSRPSQFSIVEGRATIDPGGVNWLKINDDNGLNGVYLRFVDLENFSETTFGDFLELCSDEDLEDSQGVFVVQMGANSASGIYNNPDAYLVDHGRMSFTVKKGVGTCS